MFTYIFCLFIDNLTHIGLTPGSNFPCNLWVTLNRLRTGVGRFSSDMCQVSGGWQRQPRAYARRRANQHTILFTTVKPSDHQTPLMTWCLPVQRVFADWADL